uniref:Rho GTPase activating protein 17b n=1 Tax=Neogobius melanostomus TaxID=47308 RepID=A0A8C6TIW0_9GOBI
MKKQFNRMKQLANQTVGRAEKTEVLSDDLLQIEKRMELVRLVSHNAHKRLVSCLQGQLGTDTEKRHVSPLASCDFTLSKMMDACGEAESRLATELMQHEVQLERDILEPLNQLAEVDIPNILKQRKQLAKLVLDFDSAKTRWYQATKSSNPAMAAKVDSLKDEMDEALNKVEICKDQLSADMYNFASKEGEYARYYVFLLEAQADFHRRSLAVLETAIPTIQIQQDSWMEKPAFGTALEEHLKRSNREIALPLEACVMMLLETGMKEEGLFRIAAGASKLKKLKAALDCSTSQLEEFYSDPHAVAGALKSYLRELPEPLMTFGLYDEWTQASNVPDPDKRLQALWVTCDNLPKAQKANFKYLVKFLARLAQDSETNKMSPSNIAIVLGPNLLWPKTEGTLAEMAAATSVAVVAIIEPIIQHADWFFPEEIEFNVSDMFALPSHPPTPDPEPNLERKRPGSQGATRGTLTPPVKTGTCPGSCSVFCGLSLRFFQQPLLSLSSIVLYTTFISFCALGSGFLHGKWHQFGFLSVGRWTYVVWFALLNSLPLPFTSTGNKHPEPAPRRSGTVHKKQPQLTSPTFQPPLPPLEAWGTVQPEPQAVSPVAEAELSAGTAASVGGPASTVAEQTQVVAQVSSEESR